VEAERLSRRDAVGANGDADPADGFRRESTPVEKNSRAGGPHETLEQARLPDPVLSPTAFDGRR